MRKASVVAWSIAAATAGSAIFGGVALACDHHHHDGHHKSADHDTRGGDGNGGTAVNNCINIGVPILSGNGVGGSGSSSAGGCVANANGGGGDASD